MGDVPAGEADRPGERAVLAVLTAAGTGSRLGSEGPKALVCVGGVAMVEHAARALARAGVAAVVVTAPEDGVAEFARILPGSVPGFPSVPVACVAGGGSRQESVAAGLAALPGLAARAGVELRADTPVLVHDAARPLTPVAVIERVVTAVHAGLDGVVPALPVTDTLKQVGHPPVRIGEEPGAPGGAARSGAPFEALPVVDTPERSRLWAVQTPQGFPWSVLVRAHREGAARGASEATAATDDAGLVEDLGLTVHVVRGDALSLKVTTPLDLRLAELLLETRPS